MTKRHQEFCKKAEALGYEVRAYNGRNFHKGYGIVVDLGMKGLLWITWVSSLLFMFRRIKMKPVFYSKFGVMWHHHSGEKVHEVLSYPVAVTLGAVIKHCKQRRDVKNSM
ncbi:MAG: hypothetical protein ACRCV0_06975 [Brevinema sp.]